MTYKIGTRVKKVRGLRGIGVTGVVIEVGRPSASGWTIRIRADSPICTVGEWSGKEMGPRIDFFANPDHWDPILPDGHRAGEEGRCKPLDHLLSRLKWVEA